MGREFGVEFTTLKGIPLDDWAVPLGISNTFNDGKVKFFVAPESEPIFDVIMGDFFVCDGTASNDRLRSGKAFFQAEVENV